MVVIIVFAISMLIFKNDKPNKLIYIIKSNKALSCFIFSVLIIFFIFALFEIKPNSFYGRIFVWKVTFQHLTDYFFTGIGIGNFAFYYPKWQIHYIASHSLPNTYFFNADETHVAFNEFIQIFVETGLLGLFCFTVLFVKTLCINPLGNKVFVSSIKLTLVLILASALFSYSLHCNVILFLFIFCIATLLNNSNTEYNISSIKGRKQIIAFVLLELILSTTAFKSVKEYISIRKWNALRDNLFLNPSETKLKYYDLYPTLKTNGKFLLDYGEHLMEINDLPQAVKILEESKRYYISYRTLLSCADAHYQSQNTSAAIDNLEQLSNLVPYKFYPKYKLVNLYYKSGDSTKRRAMAKFILSMPVKKMSSDVIKIKHEMLEILNQ